MPHAGEPERSALAELAKRHHLPSWAVVKAEVQGVANHVYFLGEHLVLRVARRQSHFVADLRKEAVVIPVASQLGIPTPELNARPCGAVRRRALRAGHFTMAPDGPYTWLFFGVPQQRPGENR